MKKTFALISFVSSLISSAAFAGPSPIDGLSCQGMVQGDYVTLNAAGADRLEFVRSEPLGGMLQAFKPVEEVTYGLVSLYQTNGNGFRATLAAKVMFAGSGSQTAILDYNPSRNAEDEANAKFTVHVSTFDESLGQRVEKDAEYLLSCSRAQ